jgi:hypothetical protein
VLVRLRRISSGQKVQKYFSKDQKYIFFVGQKVHIFHRTKSSYFLSNQKAHIFRRAKKCIFFAGPKVHIFRRTKSSYFSSDHKCVFFVGPKVVRLTCVGGFVAADSFDLVALLAHQHSLHFSSAGARSALRAASSAAGTKRTRSCGPTAKAAAALLGL